MPVSLRAQFSAEKSAEEGNVEKQRSETAPVYGMAWQTQFLHPHKETTGWRPR